MVIRDVIHGDIYLENELIIALIKTKEMQRLKNIKQLGLTYTVYPTTEHSRYMHSIGVYHLATMILETLEKKNHQPFDQDDKLSLQIAALLHDLGHGPYSHTSEEFFGFSHEQFTIDIIKDVNTDVNKVLTKHVPHLIDKIVSFIKKEHPHQVLNAILSATIDVDRMDYLLRDSYFAGVSYGSVDVDRIFNIIDIKNNQIVFHEKGVKTLEDFIISRYNMFLQVYLNKKSLAYEMLVRQILDEVKILIAKDYQLPCSVNKILPFFNNTISVSDYLLADDMVFTTFLNDLAHLKIDNDNQKVVFLANSFIHQNLVLKKPQQYQYSLVTKAYFKKIYHEPVLIYKQDGTIIPLEELSPLTAFLVNNIQICLESFEFYLPEYEY